MLKVNANSCPCGIGIITEDPIPKGQLIINISDFSTTDHATFQTIQIGPHAHLLDNGLIKYINHSCNPNIFINTTDLTITALRDIMQGEELTFFYPSTEWDMARPFDCICQESNCLKHVAGARYLPIELLFQYQINRHILDMAKYKIYNEEIKNDSDIRTAFPLQPKCNVPGSEMVRKIPVHKPSTLG